MSNKTKIDMSHGFMKSIIKNQVDRDNYDREVKSQKCDNKPKSKKCDQVTYVPPKRRPPPTGVAAEEKLFKLQYEDENNKIHELDVHWDDDPVELANKFGHDQNFTTSMKKAFIDFLKLEMRKAQEELVS